MAGTGSGRRGTGVLRAALLTAAFFASTALSADILETVGFNQCASRPGTPPPSVTVQKVDIRYNADNKTVTFDVAGTSTRVQNVTAILNVTAYGQQIYSNSFNPCSPQTFVQQLCPVPAGRFAAKGTQAIPKEYASLVPAIAFQIPDIAAMATLQLKSLESGASVACIQSQVTNGKTASVPAVSYVAAGVAGAALVLTGVSAVAAGLSGAASAASGGAAAAAGGSAGGMGTLSPSFGEVVGWFQSMAMNGMLSVEYPQVYRSFAKNFAFSTGIIPWTQLQVGIDSFRGMTGGDLGKDSVEVLRNSMLVFPGGQTMAPPAAQEASGPKMVRRAFERLVVLSGRQIETSVQGLDDASGAQAGNGTTPDQQDQIRQTVSGIQAYVEQLAVPRANTFMTVLLVVSIIIAAIVVGVLLVKVALEFWALFASFPKSLTGFRKHYWGSIGRAITNLILLLYGVWVLYCIFQFTNGDSWAAKTLAGISLAIFTGILVFFSWKIWATARRLRREEGDTSALYDDKNIWVKYSLFYESYKKKYWWIFVPIIIYMFVKGATLAAMDGKGMAQTVTQLIIEALLLIFLLWSRPFERRSGNVINIIIQVVRVLSVVCILVFVEEFGIAQTTQTIAGVVLIAIQSALTGILAILIAWNAIIACCKENPHRKRRKEMEKLQRDLDNLTPLDARNSLLINRTKTGLSEKSDTLLPIYTEKQPTTTMPAITSNTANNTNGNTSLHARTYSDASSTSGTIPVYRPLTPLGPGSDRVALVGGAAPLGQSSNNLSALDPRRQPTIPDLSGVGVGGGGYSGGYGGGYGGAAPRYGAGGMGGYGGGGAYGNAGYGNGGNGGAGYGGYRSEY